jgi:hypothetical protein
MPRSTELTNRAGLSTGCKIACRIATATAREATWDRLTVKLFLIGVLALADMPIGGLRDDFPEILPDEINRLEHETRALRKQFDKLDIVPSIAHEHLVSSLGRPGLYPPYFVFHRDREARVMIDQAVSIALSRASAQVEIVSNHGSVK